MAKRRDVLKYGALLPLHLAAGSLAASAQTKSEMDVLARVHPQLRAGAQIAMKASWVYGEVSEEALPRLRSFMPPITLKDPLAQRAIRIPGMGAQPDVDALVVNESKSGTPRPALLYLHGGGFVVGSAKQDASSIHDLAKALDCVVVAVNYRLAPETRWDGSLEDNYTALKWIYGNADALNINKAAIALFGSSAGGGHAALLSIAARDRGEIPLLFQSLIYPMLDDRTGSTRPGPAHTGTLIWTRRWNRFGWRCFLGAEPGGESVPIAAVPARHDNLSGLPPTFVAVGELDLFVSEDITFAQRLIAAGVPTELLVLPGAFHGFNNYAPNAPITQRFKRATYTALREAFTSAA